MAPFIHVSTDRPTRFSDGSFGVYYAGDSLAVALLEVAHHHGRFMTRTHEEPGWTSDFRQLIGNVQADLHDALTAANRDAVMAPNDWSAGQALGAALRAANANGIVYPSVRCPGGRCVALFWPDVAGIPVQGAHFALEWNGERVTRIQNLNTSELLAV